MSMIIYHDIPGFPGYRVGTDGSVWSCRIRGAPGRFGPWHRLKPKLKHDGYCVVRLRRFPKDRVRSYFIHRLILEVFVGPCPSGHQTLHKNGIRDDNRLENLRWGTQSENEADKDFHGTQPRGTKRPNTKLTEEKVKEIIILRAQGFGLKRLSHRYSVSRKTIKEIFTGRNWKEVTGF